MVESRGSEQQWFDLAGHLVHDLHSPILAALSATRQLYRVVTGRREKLQVQTAYAACSQASSILANVEFLYREKYSVGQPIRRDRLSASVLRTLVAEVREAVGLVYEPDREVQIDVHCSDSLSMIADSRALSHAFRNVIDNAFRYGFAKSPIRVVIESKEGPEPEPELVISVCSYGLPIREDEIDKCSNLGFRGRDARLNLPGSGFGLYVASRLLRYQGGSIIIRSLGAMTTVALHLPLGSEINADLDS